jgi:hypothetical protein
MWFPAHLRFFGDWFGGPLAPLYGRGIRDIRLPGDGWTSRAPAWAHARYLSFPGHTAATSVTTHLCGAMSLASGSWLPVQIDPAPPAAAADPPQTQAT